MNGQIHLKISMWAHWTLTDARAQSTRRFIWLWMFQAWWESERRSEQLEHDSVRNQSVPVKFPFSSLCLLKRIWLVTGRCSCYHIWSSFLKKEGKLGWPLGNSSAQKACLGHPKSWIRVEPQRWANSELWARAVSIGCDVRRLRRGHREVKASLG